MWIVFSLLAALTAAIVVTLSKAGIKNMDSSLAFAVQSVLILIVAWSVVIWQGRLPEVTRIEPRTWLYLVLAGVITCVSSLLSFRALKLGDAARASPLDKISLIFSIALAVIFLKEKINWQVIVGALLMAAGAVFIATSKQSAG
ncbi:MULTISPECIES: EamA family transporter [Hymenobacter]|uniref:EamA family transporter n=1 Tax=Hymenobacter jejuensis TaxID=2502781 RepID=A0A5B8A3S0_9BACT|nr:MULTISPECIES: EamA family transporter [Hymenobacter]MBC6989257.1 EamA family transporter [Hymenobacter sp. BT491]QDA61295.1 EamA family transporter [Hymenobacter jejuensis]